MSKLWVFKMRIDRPIVQYPGGKWMLAPWILEYAPTYKIYVEPFGGGGSVLLRKERSHIEIYNDLSKEVVILFKVLRDRADELEKRIKLTPYSREDFISAYQYKGQNEITIACNLIIKITQSYGTDGFKTNYLPTWRTSRERPHAMCWRSFPDYIKGFCDRLQGVVIENIDALELIKKYDTVDTWHYVDPPYVLDTRTEKSLYEYEMTDQDHIKLADILHHTKGKVCLSGYDCDLYMQLYKDWLCVKKQTHCAGVKEDKLSIRDEILWMNYDLEDQLLFFK